jgi:hypothetical protein
MTSRALAIIGDGRKSKAEKVTAEKMDQPADAKIIPPVEDLHIHSALLLAAETVVAKNAAEQNRAWLGGVFLHRREKVCRIVGADGYRMFIGSFPIEGKSPTWLTQGVLISAEGLRKRVQMVQGMQESKFIKLSHTKGHGHVEMTDTSGDAVFRLARLQIAYFDYEKYLGPESFSILDEDGNAKVREWEPIGFNSKYLKSCGEIATTLQNGLAKEDRRKEGMVIRAYTGGGPTMPTVFDFDGWPGAILAIAPARLSDTTIAKETVALIAPATKLTLAALRAHATRQLAWAEATSDPVIKAMHEGKAAGFVERIAKILQNTSTLPAIASDYAAIVDPIPMPPPAPEDLGDTSDWMTPTPHPNVDPVDLTPDPEPDPIPEPTPAPEPTPDPIADAEAAAAEAGGEEKPKVTRTKIKVGKKKAA